MPTWPSWMSPSLRPWDTLVSGLIRYVHWRAAERNLFIFKISLLYCYPVTGLQFSSLVIHLVGFELLNLLWPCVQAHDVQCSSQVICELGNPLKGNERVRLSNCLKFSLQHLDFFSYSDGFDAPDSHPFTVRCPSPSYLRRQGSICTLKR